jgi:putative transposase
MGQSLVNSYLHIVFSTKNRLPLIDDNIAEELYAYISTVCRTMESPTLRVGGHRDHVHILCMLSKRVTISKLLEITKSHSSKWIKTKGDSYTNFYWQDGYGAFSVSPTEISIVSEYISNQYEHHKKRTFQEEYLAFLLKYKVPFDEKYLWD